jgi:predicted enzyme related to lactoylglutathione lyase
MAKGKVVGIGGIFFYDDAPNELKQWYSDKLGIKVNQYGALFEFRKTLSPDSPGYLQWSVMKTDSNYFQPSQQPFMVNYRVQHLDSLLQQLKTEGIEQIGETESYEYGKFAWIMDPSGNKIEFWEPVDQVFTDTQPQAENNIE